MIGKTISQYKILEKLRQKSTKEMADLQEDGGQGGEGGMGVICKAEELKLKRTVALKFLTLPAMSTEAETSYSDNEEKSCFL